MVLAHVKPQPYVFKLLPFFSKHNGTTIFQTIYLKKEIYDNLRESNPNPRNIAILEHEEFHLKRFKEIGNVEFAVKYLMSGRFRFNEELEANKKAFKILKKSNLSLDLTKKAKALSGWVYLWSVSYDFAIKSLEKAWQEA